MKKIALPLALLASIAAGSANANPIDQELYITASVESYCEFEILNNSIHGDMVGNSIGVTSNENMQVSCNTGLPFTITTSAADGVIELQNQNGDVMYATLYAEASGWNGSPRLGSGDQAYHGVGIGAPQYVPFSVGFNKNAQGNMQFTRAEVGDYARSEAVIVSLQY